MQQGEEDTPPSNNLVAGLADGQAGAAWLELTCSAPV